jgi:hypothetical protein
MPLIARPCRMVCAVTLLQEVRACPPEPAGRWRGMEATLSQPVCET